jgi:AraC-like DNA-binding protein
MPIRIVMSPVRGGCAAPAAIACAALGRILANMQPRARNRRIPPLLGMPLVPKAGVLTAAAADPISVHRHEAWECCCALEGEVAWRVGDIRVELPGGSWAITPPGQAHGGEGGHVRPSRFLWFLVDPAAPGAEHGSPFDRAELALIPAAFAAGANRAHRGDDGWREVVRRCAEAIDVPDDDAADEGWRLARIRSALGEVLVSILRLLRGEAEIAADPRLRDAEAILTSQLEPYPVARLARRLSLSRSRLHELFQRRYGMGPTEWQLRRRLAVAAERLRGGEDSILRLALDCGFASSQSFATAFRRVYGRTPRALRTVR